MNHGDYIFELIKNIINKKPVVNFNHKNEILMRHTFIAVAIIIMKIFIFCASHLGMNF